MTIPENMAFNEIELNMKAGKLKADQIRTKNLEVNAGAGEVNILEFQAEEAEFVCGAGSVTASGDAGKKLEADCGVGELLLNLKGVKEDYNYDLECGIGEIRCADESYSGFGKDYTIDIMRQKYGNRMWHWTDYCEIYESDVKKKEIQEVTKWMEKDYTGQKKTE